MEKNLSDMRSVVRWRIVRQLMLWIGTITCYKAISYGLDASDFLQRLINGFYEKGHLHLKEVLSATILWLSAYFVVSLGWKIYKLYDLMGVHLKKSAIKGKVTSKRRNNASAA